MPPVPRALLLITLCVVGVGSLDGFGRRAAAEPCADDAAALRKELEHESSRVDHWVLAWRIVYTTAAVGEFAGAAAGVANANDTQGLWVGGAKASFAALGFWFGPLRIHVPPPTGDACTDLSMLRNASERVASDERAAFWTAHVGGLIVNAVGIAILSQTASWRTALTSFATGYPVGLLSTYTMPRASWGRVRESSWTAGVTAARGRWGLVVAGSF
jgi:hypothetical protein